MPAFNENSTATHARGVEAKGTAIRPMVLVFAAFCGLTALVLLLLSRKPAETVLEPAPPADERAHTAPSAAAPTEPPSIPQDATPPGKGSAPIVPVKPKTETAATPAAKPEPAPPPASPETRRLVESLTSLGPPGAPFTPEQAAAWRENLQRLV